MREAPYSIAILNGVKINTLKSKTGQKLHDGYLAEEVAKRYPWIKRVYDETSGFIHLSRRHLWLAVNRTEESTRSIAIEISGEDNRADKDYTEIVEAFIGSTELIIELISVWIVQKSGR